MDYTFLSGTGIKVSRLAMGTMTFGGDADVDASRAMYRAAREAGINHFDTADVYNKGRTEEILGELIANDRDQIVLATKAYFPAGPGQNDRGSSRYHLVRSLEGSLKRLRTDRVDLFYLHRFDERTDLEESLRALDDLVTRGLVLHPAVSNFAAWQVTKALGISALRNLAKIVAVQPMYNLAKRTAEIELLPMAQSERLAVFPYSPLGGGLFSGKYRASEKPKNVRIADWPLYQHRYGDKLGLAEQFSALAAEAGVHPATLAVSWVMTHPAVTAPLLGARSLEQLQPALAAASYVMDPALRTRISALVPEPPPPTDRNEEGVIEGLGAR